MHAITANDHGAYARLDDLACPQCRGSVHRMHRRPLDRLRSFVSPVHRFRCETFGCGWEGNVRISPQEFEASERMPLHHPGGSRRHDGLPMSFVIMTSLALAGFLSIALVGTTGLYEVELAEDLAGGAEPVVLNAKSQQAAMGPKAPVRASGPR